MLKELPLKEFIDELASSSPAPGGGSVAALAGSLSSALAAMVIHLTVDKGEYQENREELRAKLPELEALKKRLCADIDEDTRVFNEVIGAFKLPKDTAAAKELRANTIQKAMQNAALIPLEVAKNCLSAMHLIKLAAEKGNPQAVSDAGVACLLAYAGLHGALLNVEINLGSIKDEQFVRRLQEQKETILQEGKLLQEAILQTVDTKLSK
ncbi:MAG: cyclodeaminase/cyclohydrolase family protein [Peptococcaceae bacterium]